MPRYTLRTLILVMLLLPPVIGFVWRVGVEEAFLYLCWLIGVLGFASAAIVAGVGLHRVCVWTRSLFRDPEA